MITKLCTIIQI